MISVLFVDDASDLLVQIRSHLEKTGEIRVDSAHSIKQAIEKLKGRTYDVILSYEQMPEVNGIEFVSEMDGIEFVKYLRSIGNPTPLILLSRKGAGRIVLGEVSIAARITLPKSGDLRPQIAEMVTLIKQSMLRKKGEREMKAQNDQLTGILAATPLGIFQTQNNTIPWVNSRFAAMLGYEEGQLVGKDLRVLFRTPEEYELFSRDIQIRRDQKGYSFTECNLVKKDQSLLPCQVQAQVLDPRDLARGGTFIVTDISDRKKIAEALRESEAKYRDLLQNTQNIIIRMDMQGTITFFNHYALTFFDYTSDEVIGKNVIGTIVPQKTRSGHDLSVMADDLGFNA